MLIEAFVKVINAYYRLVLRSTVTFNSSFGLTCKARGARFGERCILVTQGLAIYALELLRLSSLKVGSLVFLCTSINEWAVWVVLLSVLSVVADLEAHLHLSQRRECALVRSVVA